MPKKDKHLSEVTEARRNLMIDMGTEVFLQVEKVVGRFPSKFLGMDLDNYLIFKMPKAQLDLSNRLVKGTGVIVRYRYQGRIYGFQSTILGISGKPFSMLIMKPPELIEEHNLRQRDRLDCYLPCSVDMGGEVESGVVVNISHFGCRCIFSAMSWSKGEKAASQHIDVIVKVALQENDGVMELNGRVSSAHQFHGAVSAGIEFVDMSQETELKLKSCLLEWL